MYQNRAGEMMRDIRDEGMGGAQALWRHRRRRRARPSFHPARAPCRAGQLRFHTDRCDVVGLFCVRQARQGGVSKLASSATVYNEILKRRPDLHALLCKPIPRSRFGEEAGGEHVTYDLPVFGVQGGKLTSHFSLTYIESAQMMPGVRKLIAAEHEAIRMLMEVAEEECFEMRFVPGDIQLLNNHVIYHGRTAFKDDESERPEPHVDAAVAVGAQFARPAGRSRRAVGRCGCGQPHGGIAQPATVAAMSCHAMRQVSFFSASCCFAVSRALLTAAPDYGNCKVTGTRGSVKLATLVPGALSVRPDIARAGLVEWRLARHDQGRL